MQSIIAPSQSRSYNWGLEKNTLKMLEMTILSQILDANAIHMS